MICGRCDRAIMVGEPYDEHDKVSSSAGGITIYLHKRCPSMSRRSERQGRGHNAPTAQLRQLKREGAG